MESKSLITLSAILLAFTSCVTAAYQNSWSAYSDSSSFRDVLQGRSYEEAFGDSYDNMFGSSLTGGSYGGGGGASGVSEERNPIRVIQPKSDVDYGTASGPRYQSPAVTVRSGHRVSAGSGYGSQQSPQSTFTASPKARKIARSGYASGGQAYAGQTITKPAYGSTSTKTTQQRDDYGSDGYGAEGGAGGHNEIPDTGFQCLNRYYGYYADVGAGCQVFHVCQPDGQKWSFWCPNGTLYHQKVQTCDWWYNVDCAESPDFYFLNERIGVLPPQDATLHRF